MEFLSLKIVQDLLYYSTESGVCVCSVHQCIEPGLWYRNCHCVSVLATTSERKTCLLEAKEKNEPVIQASWSTDGGRVAGDFK